MQLIVWEKMHLQVERVQIKHGRSSCSLFSSALYCLLKIYYFVNMINPNYQKLSRVEENRSIEINTMLKIISGRTNPLVTGNPGNLTQDTYKYENRQIENKSVQQCINQLSVHFISVIALNLHKCPVRWRLLISPIKQQNCNIKLQIVE